MKIRAFKHRRFTRLTPELFPVASVQQDGITTILTRAQMMAQDRTSTTAMYKASRRAQAKFSRTFARTRNFRLGRYRQYWVTPTEYKDLMARYEWWRCVDFAGADAQVPAITEKLIRLPGVVPVWSCEGHADQKGLWDHMYWIFAGTEEGVWHLVELGKRLYEKLLVVVGDSGCETGTWCWDNQLNFQFGLSPRGRQEFPILDYRITDAIPMQYKPLFLQAFHEVLDQMLTELAADSPTTAAPEDDQHRAHCTSPGEPCQHGPDGEMPHVLEQSLRCSAG